METIKNDFKNKDGGFLRLIILIVVLLLLMKYFHISFADLDASLRSLYKGFLDFFTN
jgi:hypothetical protein